MMNDDASAEDDINSPVTENSKDADTTYSIGELADEFCITTRAIRFYETRGLISPSRAGASRIYSVRDHARLKIILRGKNLGFTLEDIGDYLSLHDTSPTKQAQTEMLLNRVEELICDLELKRSDLDGTLLDLRELKDKCITVLQANASQA